MATYLNDLRLTELATGEGSGTWGTTTNTSLELIGEALGYATQQVFGSDADATTTIADGASDPARAMYFKITSAGSLTATRTCTIAPNTVSRVMFIENATTGSQSIAISQGSGASVTILAGKTAVVYLDGAGSGAAVVDAMAGVDPGVTDTLAEVLAAGNTSGANNLIIDNGQAITTNTINETTAASGVTIDSVLLKDDGVNATNLEITNLKANDGTSAGSIADSTGVVTIASAVLTTADINGGTMDGVTIGGASTAAGSFTTVTASGRVTFGELKGTGATVVNTILDEDNMATNSDTALATQQSIKAYVDSQVGTVDTLAEILANGNTSGANNLIITAGQSLTADSILETSAGNGVNIDSVVLKDGDVNGTIGQVTAKAANFTTVGASSNVTVGGTLGVTGATTLTGNLTVDTNTLFVDATNNRVQIGSTSARSSNALGYTQLSVESASFAGAQIFSNIASADGSYLGLWKTRGGALGGTTNVQDGDSLGGVIAGGWGDGAFRNSSAIIFEVDGSTIGSTSMPGRITFFTSASGTASYVERTRIDNVGTLIHKLAATFNEDGADADFRVESDSNTHALFVDAGNSRVGIGTASPSTGVEIAGAFNGSGGLAITQNSGNGNGGRGPSVDFLISQSEDGSVLVTGGRIATLKDDGSDASGAASMVFYTSDSTPTLTERMSITSAGTLQHQNAAVFNESGGDNDFRVESDSNTYMLFVDGGNDHVNIGTATDFGETLNIDGGIHTSATMFVSRQTNDTGSSGVMFEKTRSTTVNGNTIVQNGDQLGYIGWSGNDGDQFIGSAYIIGYVDGAPGNNDMPTRLDFLVTADGSDIATNRMRLGSSGAFTTYPATGAHAVFNEDGVDADFRVESDTNANMFVVDASTDRVGVGVAAPLETLHVAGSVFSSSGYYITVLQGNAQLTNASTSSGSNASYIGQGLITVVVSDAKAKENFGAVEENECLNKIVSLSDHVKKFDWIDEDWKREKGRTVGMVAQEVYEDHSEFVHKPENYNDDGWAIRYQEIVPTLIKAFQEQQELIKTLESRIAALES
jgi:hypothetical protein